MLFFSFSSPFGPGEQNSEADPLPFSGGLYFMSHPPKPAATSVLPGKSWVQVWVWVRAAYPPISPSERAREYKELNFGKWVPMVPSCQNHFIKRT